MKKQTTKTTKKIPNTETQNLNWKNKRDIISNAIDVEVDLQNREIFFKSDIRQKLHFDFDTNNVDHLIKTYLEPLDSQQVMESLTEAEKGMEKPISFNFIHPLTSRSYKFEYKYQIIYVKYASTRLQGKLKRK